MPAGHECLAAPLADAFRIDTEITVVLGQEPQRCAILQPAVLDVIGIDPRVVVQPVLADDFLVVEVDRCDPAILVVDGAHVKRHVLAIR